MNTALFHCFVKRRISCFVLSVFACLCAHAQENNLMDDTFTVYLGGFFPSVNSGIRLDRDDGGGVGDDTSFENTLGLADSADVAWGGINWRIAERHSLEFEYFQLNRSGRAAAVTDPFQIGNSLVQAGAQLETVFDVAIGRITYAFAPIHDEKNRLAIEGGIHWLRVDTAIDLTGAVVDLVTGTSITAGESRSEGGDISAPLPHLGIVYARGLSSNVLARIQVLGFALSIDEYSGSLIDAGFDFAYSPWKNFGIGAGYRYFRMQLDVDRSNLNGEFEFDYFGPTVFVVGSF